MPRSLAFPPVECWRGTRPSQAARSRLLRKAVPFPMAAGSAVAVRGPMPGMVSRRRQLSSLFAASANSWSTSLICSSSFSHSCRSSVRSARMRDDNRLSTSLENGRNLSLEMSRSCGDGNTMLQQKPTNMIYDRSSPPHPAIAHTVQGLKIQLCFVLNRNKAHRGALHSFSDCFCIDVVVLIRFNEGANVLGRHELHFVPLSPENTCQKVGTGTSLHADQTGGNVHHMRDELLPREALLDDDLAFLAQAD